MKILLACSAGMSTSLLEKSIQDYMDANGITGDVIAKGSESAKQEIADWDIVLLGPQVKFMLPAFQALAGGKPVAVIPPHFYALANGEEVYKLAVELLGK